MTSHSTSRPRRFPAWCAFAVAKALGIGDRNALALAARFDAAARRLQKLYAPHHRTVVAVAALALAAVILAGGAVLYRLTWPHRFTIIQDGVLYRSGQPNSEQLAHLVRRYDIKTFVSLRKPHKLSRHEVRFAKRRGLNLVHIPTGHTVPLSYEQIARFLSVVDNPNTRPVLVHCSLGRTRASAYTAIYRRYRCGWPREQVAEELRKADFEFDEKHMLLKESALADPADLYACPDTQPPTHVCLHTSDAVTIDGVLKEHSWRAAVSIPLVLRDASGPPKRPTIAKMCWDETNLYVAFTCTDPHIWATLTKRDDPLWTEEVVELFLDPNGTGKPYFEIEINPRNVVVDLRFDEPISKGAAERGIVWNAKGLQSAVRVNGRVTTGEPGNDPEGSWTVEMALPFGALDGTAHLPPRNGDSWRANLYRIERPPELGKEDDEYTAWSPLYDAKSYHTRKRFGRIVFCTTPMGQK